MEWVAFPFSRGSSQPRARTQGSNPETEPRAPTLQADYQLIHREAYKIGEVIVTASHPSAPAHPQKTQIPSSGPI